MGNESYLAGANFNAGGEDKSALTDGAFFSPPAGGRQLRVNLL